MRNVSANDAHVDHFGLTPADVHGRHISDLLGPSAYALARPHIEAALAGVEQLRPPSVMDRAGLVRYTQESYIPDLVGGEVRGVYHYITDVTALVDAQDERDEAVRLFQLSMINAPIGKVVLTTSGYVLQVNPALCRMLGYAAKDLIGNDFRRYVPPRRPWFR